jgi:hypothetical protein
VLAVTALGIGFLAGMVAGAIIQREGYLTQVASDGHNQSFYFESVDFLGKSKGRAGI